MHDIENPAIPDWAIKGRKITPEWRKRRAAKRTRRFVIADWGWLAPALRTIRSDRPTRLLLVLCLHAKLQRVAARGGWIELVRHDLDAAGLLDGNLYKVVARLETLGLIDVQRRPGKRPLVRLVKS
jgi:hypothetical protein